MPAEHPEAAISKKNDFKSLSNEKINDEKLDDSRVLCPGTIAKVVAEQKDSADQYLPQFYLQRSLIEMIIDRWNVGEKKPVVEIERYAFTKDDPMDSVYDDADPAPAITKK